MTDNQKESCQVIIHGAATAAAVPGAGLAQIPLADHLVIIPIQIGMVVALGSVFGIEITESTAKSMVWASAATFVGHALSQLFVGWIPGFGNALNASTAFGITESIGWTVANDFASRN